MGARRVATGEGSESAADLSVSREVVSAAAAYKQVTEDAGGSITGVQGQLMEFN